ncbi:hypothetical protein, partial [Microcoleus sp. herbarium14]|uniref:hypothetical protein n=1 Tax=Microcoleus sp. herbarium14 TaxID=3055439 RepID=UPI002FCF3EBA
AAPSGDKRGHSRCRFPTIDRGARNGILSVLISGKINSDTTGIDIQRIPGLWSAVGTRHCRFPTGIYRSGIYFINVESAVC